MEYQPCVASGSKKAARVEAAVVCLQELAALPMTRETTAVQPEGVPVPVVPPQGPRPVLGPPSHPLPQPRPVRPLMSLQPRPRFDGIPLHQPPGLAPPGPAPPTMVTSESSEPAPPGVTAADFTADIFDDLQRFELTLMQASVGGMPAGGKSSTVENAFAEDDQEVVGFGTEQCEIQSEDVACKTSHAFGLLGDAPPEFEDDDVEGAFDVDYDGMQFSDRPNAAFGRPFYPECADFAEDTFNNDGPGILGEYCRGADEPFCDYFEPCAEFGPWDEDFQSDVCFRNPIGFGPRGMRPARPLMQQPFNPRGPRSPVVSCRPPWIPRHFPPGPQQRFCRPSFGMPLPRCPAPLPRGMFRPSMRPVMRPFL